MKRLLLRVRRWGWTSPLVFACAFASAGCKSTEPRVSASRAAYKARNVFSAGPVLPSFVRRVAVLPLTHNEQQPDADAGQTALEPVLHEELGRISKFEIVLVTHEQLRRWTGRPTWTSQDRLPPAFFPALRAEFDCDAVLFCHLTRFHAYPPMAVGWQLRLVDALELRTLWSVDEIFDAGNLAVEAGARKHETPRAFDAGSRDARGVLNSPRSFGRFAASAALATLPER